MNRFNREMLNLGVLMANYGLIALSTPMWSDDIERIAEAAHRALTVLRNEEVL